MIRKLIAGAAVAALGFASIAQAATTNVNFAPAPTTSTWNITVSGSVDPVCNLSVSDSTQNLGSGGVAGLSGTTWSVDFGKITNAAGAFINGLFAQVVFNGSCNIDGTASVTVDAVKGFVGRGLGRANVSGFTEQVPYTLDLYNAAGNAIIASAPGSSIVAPVTVSGSSLSTGFGGYGRISLNTPARPLIAGTYSENITVTVSVT